ncbi:MAG: endonuclease [Bacilli bacterium]|nr:endonuclease [Bacilli bacterium]
MKKGLSKLRKGLLVLPLSMTLLCTGCSQEDVEDTLYDIFGWTELVPCHVDSVMYTIEKTQSLKVGQTLKLQWKVAPWNADNKNVNFYTGDPTIATVSNDGVITAVGEGSTTIKVKTVDRGRSDIIDLTVTGEEKFDDSTYTPDTSNITSGIKSVFDGGLNTDSSSMFKTTKVETLQTYYASLSSADTGDTLLTKLSSLLKKDPVTNKDQAKVTYTSGLTESKSGSGTAWRGYFLYERDYKCSPLTSAELTGNKYNYTGVWVNSLYCKSPIYCPDGINGTKALKYYSDYSLVTHSGSAVVEGSFGVKVANAAGTLCSKNAQFDREHCYPKSYGFNNSTNATYEGMTAGCDAHNLRIGEAVGNQDGHNDLPFGIVANHNTATKLYSSITGEPVGFRGNNANGVEVYEPSDEDKGDIARALMYMAARYHVYETQDPFVGNAVASPKLVLGDEVYKATTTVAPEGTQDGTTVYGVLTDLLKWHKEDPVDDYEIRRNDLIYNYIQYNRNPFVDIPSLADACFGNGHFSFKDFELKAKYCGTTFITQ